MGSRYLTDLADVVRGAGLDVQEEGGWQSRARGSGGYSGGLPCAVMVHHTASGPSSDGQPDVDYMCYRADARPIANLYLSRSGKVWVMAAGATNTNGSGGPLGPVPADSMNSSAIGIEAGNDGVGEAWSVAQQDAYVRLVSALCAHYAIPTGQAWSHAEWAPGRKVDPAGPCRWTPAGGTWPMAEFRADLGTPLPPSPTAEVPPMVIVFQYTGQPDAWYVTDGVQYRRLWDIANGEAVLRLWRVQLGYPAGLVEVQQLNRDQIHAAGVPAPGESPIPV
jgi:hypothetical protein